MIVAMTIKWSGTIGRMNTLSADGQIVTDLPKLGCVTMVRTPWAECRATAAVGEYDYDLIESSGAWTIGTVQSLWADDDEIRATGTLWMSTLRSSNEGLWRELRENGSAGCAMDIGPDGYLWAVMLGAGSEPAWPGTAITLDTNRPPRLRERVKTWLGW